MRRTTLARLVVVATLIGAFAFAGWQLMSSAPQSKRERPAAPVPLVDVVPTLSEDHPLRLSASGSLRSAEELEIRPEVGGRIRALHPDFEPGGRIGAGETLIEIADDEYRLAVAAAEADIAKARAAIALEQGRRVVAREELDLLKGSVDVDPASRALALRRPQLRQVQAELTAAQNRLERAKLDLARTHLSLPYNVIVLERKRVANEVVAPRELIGRVARADKIWLELRVQPQMLRHIHARNGEVPGSQVRLVDDTRTGEVVRIRADVAENSRLAGVIAEFPITDAARQPLLLGSYVRAEIDGGVLSDVIAIPRRALRDNRRVWVVDRDDRLQVRRARVAGSSGQQLFVEPGGGAEGLHDGDRIVVSRIDGLIPGTVVRQREIDPASGRTLIAQTPDRQDG